MKNSKKKVILILRLEPCSYYIPVLCSTTETKHALWVNLSYGGQRKLNRKGVYLRFVRGLKKAFKQVLLYTNAFNAL